MKLTEAGIPKATDVGYKTADVRDKLVELVKKAPAGGLFTRADIIEINDDHTFFVRLYPDTEFFQVRVTV